MFESAKPFLLSLALGLMLGIERERRSRGEEASPALGARTFALIALLGTLAAHLGSPGIAVVFAAFVAAIAVAAYVRPASETPARPRGSTTEMAAVATFAVGVLAHGEPRLAAMIGVMVLAILWLKPKIHRFAHEGLTDPEVDAGLTFLVIALVVLPLLPNRTVDPWDLINPSRLWLLFVLIAGVGFAGYIAVRALGPSRGLAVAGFAAGLVSSTAATLSLSRRARTEPQAAGSLTVGIVLANVASAGAQILVVGIANAPLLGRATMLLGAPILVGIAGSAARVWWLGTQEAASPDASFRLQNPLELRPAVVMAGALALVLAATAAASRAFGAAGAIAAAALAGTTDVHAATLAAATLERAGELGASDALLAILVAFLVNMGVKIAIVAASGGRRLAVWTAPPLLAMAASAALAYALMPARP